MKTFRLTILGTNAAHPGFGRITSCQILEYDNRLILIDCGEGCQIRLNQYKIKRSKLELICISHLHGDHIFGLPGLLNSLSLSGREKSLTICGPSGISQFIQQIQEITEGRLSYPINYIEINSEEPIIVDVGFNERLQITAFPMKHRIETYGYRFDELTGPFNIRKEMIPKYNLQVEEIRTLKLGKNVERENGDILNYKLLTHPQANPRSYAYCSDTIYDPNLVEVLKEVDVLYHETTYQHELKHLAEERMHATSVDAANLAKLAKVGSLITGHYSSRYRHVDDLVKEAQEVFSNTIKGYDGTILDIGRSHN